MNLTHFAPTLFVLAGMAALPVTSMAAAQQSCVQGQPTSASYHWDFTREASRLLSSIQEDAVQARSNGAQLQSFTADPYVSWEAHAGTLMRIRHEINDMGQRLCRLEQIRRAVAPWQQKAIDEIVPTVRFMADNETDAVNFLNGNHDRLWETPYPKYVNNLYQEASSLSRSVKEFEEYAAAHRQELRLEKTLDLGSHS